MAAALGRVIIYTKKIDEMIDFYCGHFGFRAERRADDRIVELQSQDGGALLLLYPIGKGRRQGQSLVKLVFDVEDVTAFCAEAARNGLTFKSPQDGGGYLYANAEDPSGNLIQVSGRAFRAEG